MNRTELLALHQAATETRNAAHQAYQMALKNRRAHGDADAAFTTLLKTNQIRDRLYAAILALAVEGDTTKTEEDKMPEGTQAYEQQIREIADRVFGHTEALNGVDAILVQQIVQYIRLQPIHMGKSRVVALNAIVALSPENPDMARSLMTELAQSVS